MRKEYHDPFNRGGESPSSSAELEANNERAPVEEKINIKYIDEIPTSKMSIKEQWKEYHLKKGKK